MIIAAGVENIRTEEVTQWVELQDVFSKALSVRTLGAEAAELADRLFLETMVRIHRVGRAQPDGRWL